MSTWWKRPSSVGDGGRRAVAHPQRAGLVVGGAETVPSLTERQQRSRRLVGRGRGERSAADEDLVGLGVGEDPGDVIGRLVHDVPQLAVLRGLWGLTRPRWTLRVAQLDDGAWDRELVEFPVESDPAVGVVRLHFADAADGDHDGGVGGVQEPLEQVDVGVLLEQLRFGVPARLGEAGGGDLQMEVSDGAVGERVAALDEQGGGGQLVAEPRRQRARRDADGDVRPQVGHQVGADEVDVGKSGKGDQRQASALDRAGGDHHTTVGGHGDRARAGEDAGDTDAGRGGGLSPDGSRGSRGRS